jgi:transposase-like protein
MQKAQKTYTQEFKREAVRLAQTSGKPIAQVARELGISDSSIHQWRKELADHGGFRVSRQWAPDRFGGRKSPSQTGTGENATRTRYSKKNRKSLLARPAVRYQVVEDYRKD